MSMGVPVWRCRLAGFERTRRLATAAAIAVIVVAALAPLIGHHLLQVDGDVLERGRIVAFCVVLLRAIMEPLHQVFHVLLWAGFLYAAWDRLQAWRLGRRELSILAVSEAGFCDTLWLAARASGIDPSRVRAVSGLPGAALTVGWRKPLVYVSHEMLERLSYDQLVAVLTHEGAHLRRRDPLRMSVLRFLSCMFFWLPVLRQLTDDLADEIEILADDEAAARHPLLLASALVEVAKFGRPPLPSIAVGFHDRPLFERRIRRLLGEEHVPGSHLTRGSTIGGMVALLLAVTSGLVIISAPTGPMSHYSNHCDRHDMPMIGHLLCLFDRTHRVADVRAHPLGSAAGETDGLV